MNTSGSEDVVTYVKRITATVCGKPGAREGQFSSFTITARIFSDQVRFDFSGGAVLEFCYFKAGASEGQFSSFTIAAKIFCRVQIKSVSLVSLRASSTTS